MLEKLNIKGLLEMSPKIISAIAIASGAILFIPIAIAQKLYLVDFRNKYGFTIGIVFLISVSILLTTLIVKLHNMAKNKAQTQKRWKNKIELINGLSEHEKRLIKEIMSTPDNTLSLNYGSGLTKKMEKYQIISRLAQHTTDMDYDGNLYFPYGVNPWVFQLAKSGKINLG